MDETGPTSPQTLVLVGVLIVLALLLEGALRRSRIPPLVGHLLLGVGLAVVDFRWGALPEGAYETIDFLASIGVVILLFHIGLRSDVRGLVAQLPRASGVWLGNVALSSVLGYLAARHLLGADVLPSLFVAVALMATSVTVSVGCWEQAGALRSPNGALLIDVAEADDLSSVAAMMVLFAVAPMLMAQQTESLVAMASAAAAWLVVKALAFAAGCLLFAVFVEERFTRTLRRLTRGPDRVIVIAGAGVVIAGLAGWLGLSIAVGALLAGLLFSRDRGAVRTEPSLRVLDDLFRPFFFVGVGLQVDPDAVAGGLVAGGLLLIPAIAGKVLGAGLPALPQVGWAGAALIGVSMVPRAEIAMIVARQGQRLGDLALPPALFAALTTVSLTTALATPLLLRMLLARWPQAQREAP